MLSRFAFRGKDLVKCLIVRHQSSGQVTCTTPSNSQPSEKDQRDYVNFPDYKLPETPPPHKLIVIPASWFEAFYPKTGVTGPYVLLTGFFTYCFSKEIIILEHHAANLASLVILFSFIHYKFGDKISEWYQKSVQTDIDKADSQQQKQIDDLKNHIEEVKKEFFPEEFLTEVSKLKKEIVHFQMEAVYRERLIEAYNKIKKSLDYQMALENVEKSFAQKNLIDYVVKNVLSSITAEKEKSVLEKCILDLNTLAQKY